MQRHGDVDDLAGDPLAQALNDEFVRQFGPMLPSSALVKALGYRSGDAFRQALARGTVPVPLFHIPTRRGRFALARDVALWICEQRRGASSVTGRDVSGIPRPRKAVDGVEAARSVGRSTPAVAT